jgi:hypothetical protein
MKLNYLILILCSLSWINLQAQQESIVIKDIKDTFYSPEGYITFYSEYERAVPSNDIEYQSKSYYIYKNNKLIFSHSHASGTVCSSSPEIWFSFHRYKKNKNITLSFKANIYIDGQSYSYINNFAGLTDEYFRVLGVIAENHALRKTIEIVKNNNVVKKIVYTRVEKNQRPVNKRWRKFEVYRYETDI